MAEDMDAEGREVETLIEDWNASRVDIFAISKPNNVGFITFHYLSFLVDFMTMLWFADSYMFQTAKSNPFFLITVSELGILWCYAVLFSRTRCER